MFGRFFCFQWTSVCEACGWSAVEQLAEVQVLRLTMELALARAEAGDTVRLMTLMTDDHCLQKKGTFHSQFPMRVLKQAFCYSSLAERLRETLHQ